MRDDKTRLLDILEAIELLEKNISKGKSLHELDELSFLGVVHCIEIIGEACNHITDKTKAKYTKVPWRQISNMRNILAHQYFNVDAEKIEKVIKDDLPKFKINMKKILDELT